MDSTNFAHSVIYDRVNLAASNRSVSVRLLGLLVRFGPVAWLVGAGMERVGPPGRPPARARVRVYLWFGQVYIGKTNGREEAGSAEGGWLTAAGGNIL